MASVLKNFALWKHFQVESKPPMPEPINGINKTMENRESDMMRDILTSMGIENGSIQDFWKYRLENPDKSAENIFVRLHDAVEKIDPLQSDQLSSVMEKLFSPENTKEGTKEKIRAVFYKAVHHWKEKKQKGNAIYEKSFEGRLIQAICMIEGEEAFMSIGNGANLPPFHYAAMTGDSDTVQFMIDKLESSNVAESDIIELLSQQYKKETPFELAAKNICDDVVQLLFKKYRKLADTVQSMKSQCIEKVIQAIANTEGEKALSIFRMIVQDADDAPWLQHVWEKAVESEAISVLNYLMNEKPGSSFNTHENANLIIKSGTYGMWELFSSKSLESLFKKECDLLHNAVFHGKFEVVQDILERFPDQIKVTIDQQGKSRSALHFLAENQNRLSKQSYDELRNLLVHAMIKSDMAIGEIKEIGDSSGVEGLVQSMSLHFSDIDTKSQNFAEYVQSLKDHQSSYMKFETVLKYTNFPDLETYDTFAQVPSISMLGTDHTEISDTISWLKDRNVKQLVELIVSDRLLSPHTDDQVSDCVKDLHIMILDWKKPDLYLPGLERDKLEKLNLYSSGDYSAIDQWSNELPKFPKLKELQVFIIEDIVGKNRVETIRKRLQAKIELDPKVKVKIDKCQWFNSTEKIANYRDFSDITLDIAGKEMKEFLGRFKKFHIEKKNNSPPRIKIALIDSGVVVVGRRSAADHPSPTQESELSRRIVDGVSFVNSGNKEYLWWHASEPHGTQMATIICAMNPCCDLYVAKVAEKKTSSLTATNVAKAIQWAIQKKVDIISLSLVIFGDQSWELTKAINEAINKDITIICSTADEGHSSVRDILSKLGSEKKVIAVAACNQHGKPLDQSQEDKFIYRFSGENIQIGAVPFLKSENHVTGSSVATAIAAATASLILSCCGISSKFIPDPNDGWKRDKITEMFGKMSDDVGSSQLGPWVRPHNICGSKRLERKYDFQTVVEEVYNSEYKEHWKNQ